MTSPPLARDTPDGRMYVNPVTGEKAPSITTIQKVIAKPDIATWAGRMSAEYMNENWEELAQMKPWQRVIPVKTAHEAVSSIARDLGTAVHATMEAWIKGIPAPELPPKAKPFARQLTGFFMEKRPDFTHSEFTVWSRKHGYAGTGDFIATVDGKTVLGDLKTGRGLYAETGLQCAALANADFIIREDGTEEEIPPLDYLAALHVRPRSWKFVPLRHEAENFAAFLAARKIWGWQHETAPYVLEAA